MAITQGIVALFKAEASITSLLDTTAAIANDTIDQGISLPHISISGISEDYMGTLTSSIGSLRSREIDIDCVAESKVEADSIADAVEAYFGDFTGTAGDHTIKAVLLQDRGEDKIPVNQASQRFKYVTTVTAQVMYF